MARRESGRRAGVQRALGLWSWSALGVLEKLAVCATLVRVKEQAVLYGWRWKKGVKDREGGLDWRAEEECWAFGVGASGVVCKCWSEERTIRKACH